MELRFECSNCGQHVSATPEQIGTTEPCPNCNTPITVPNPLTSSTPPAPSTTRTTRNWMSQSLQIIGWIVVVIIAAAGRGVFKALSPHTRTQIMGGALVGIGCALLPYFLGRRKHPRLAKEQLLALRPFRRYPWPHSRASCIARTYWLYYAQESLRCPAKRLTASGHGCHAD